MLSQRMASIPTTLHTPPLRRLLAAQIPADFADWLDFVAIGALLAFGWDAEPLAFAYVAAAVGLPYVVVGPIAGAVVDRADIRTVLIASNVGRAVATACLFLATDLPTLMLIVAIRSSMDAFYSPAKQAAIQSLAPPHERQAANGISHGINQASKIAAPALGGLLLVLLAPGMVFLINAAVSLVAAMILIGMPIIARDRGLGNGTLSITLSLKEGYQTVAGAPVLRGALLVMALGYFSMFFYDTLIAPLIRGFGFNQTMFAIAIAAVGLGGVLGAFWLGLGKDKKHPFIWVAIGSGISGILAIVLGISQSGGYPIGFAAITGLFAVLGFCSAIVVVPIRTVIQNETPPDKIARVSALGEAANTTALLVAPFIGAAIATATSVGTVFVLGGVLLGGVASYATMLNRRISAISNQI
ncbi:MAG: MFS transporter [Paracoccaceae bacterium]